MQPRRLAYIPALCLTIALLPGALAGQPAAPLLTEVQPDPVGDDAGREWFELHNPAPAPLPLEGLYVTDHDACFLSGVGFVPDYRMALNGTIPPRGRIVVTLPGDCLTLANAGDELFLEDEEGRQIQNATWGPDAVHPAPATGASLAACHALATHGWWRVAHATPGEANRACGPSVETSVRW